MTEITAANALECAKAIMDKQKRGQLETFIGEWNTLMLYLEQQVRLEKK